MKRKTGFRLVIQDSNCSIYHGLLDFRDLTIKNPENDTFKQEDLVRFHQVRASIDWISLYRSYFPGGNSEEIVIPEVDIDVEKLICEPGKHGEYNFKLLGDQFAAQNGDSKKLRPKDKSAPHKSENGSKLRFVIAKVRFHLGSCELYKRDGTSKVVAVDRTWHFENIRSWSDVARSIVADVQAMGLSVAVGGLLDLVSDLPILKTAKRSLKAVHRTSKNLAKKAVDSAQKLPSVKEVWDNSLEALKVSKPDPDVVPVQ
ncbi:MAG: hypothetical protein LW808_003135 [Verrucomicrobiota bacterium]|nr:MAG: hypothetical protein LW808_003135 [Verrucomicrobiota bacterium]